MGQSLSFDPIFDPPWLWLDTPLNLQVSTVKVRRKKEENIKYKMCAQNICTFLFKAMFLFIHRSGLVFNLSETINKKKLYP